MRVTAPTRVTFSVGDPHACQGDSEVGVTLPGCPMRTTLCFSLDKRSAVWSDHGINR